MSRLLLSLAAGAILMIAPGVGPSARNVATARQVTQSDSVIRSPDPSADLPDRWRWALGECGRRDCVIGYTITRHMRGGNRIGWTDGDGGARQTLEELLTGRRPEPWVDDDRFVEKPVAILFGMRSGATEPHRVRVATFDSHIELEGRPLVWLGSSGPESSLGHVTARFDAAADEGVRRGLVWAVGMHPVPRVVVPWLTRVVRGSDRLEVRKAALYALADTDDESALGTLAEVALSATTEVELRKAAVYALSDMESDGVRDILVELMKRAGIGS